MFAPEIRLHQIAYFSMEIGLDSALPTYSGGLGILAGDTLRAAADCPAHECSADGKRDDALFRPARGRLQAG